MEPHATAEQVWAASLIFARIGAVVMLIPGIGEAYVPPRIRLALALLVTLALTPVIAPALPPLPASVGGMTGWVLRELITGLMIGALMRMMIAAMGIAGEIASLQTALGFAQTANPMQAQPGTTLSAFLTLMAVTLVFATGTHHLFIAGIAGSYEVITLGAPLMMGDFTTLAVRTLGQSFLLGVQLAAPLMVFSLIFNLASGLIGRVMPSFQIYFAAAPLNVLLGLSVFALSLGVIGMMFIDRYQSFLQTFAGGAGG